VGSTVTKRADIRFIAATNHNLKSDIKERRFREDLFYRLNVINIDIPPLRERKQDIPLLAYHFMKKYARMNQKDIQDISPSAIQALLEQDFAGNVRELENIMERSVIFCRADRLEVKDLFLDNERESFYPGFEEGLHRLSFKEAKNRTISIFHEHYVRALLEESRGNISRAAEMAGIQRQYLHRLMKEAGVNAREFKR